jgi:hypothetical protein
LGRASDLYLLEDGEYCDAMPKKCVHLISKDQFDFFKPRTDFIKQFIAENDKETGEQHANLMEHCPDCDGLHFNLIRNGDAQCSSVNSFGKIGCGWSGRIIPK